MVRRLEALAELGLRALLCLAGVTASGCFDVNTVELGVEVTPDDNGLVDPRKNELGLSGHWYSYGDQYDAPRACTQIGMHEPEECSLVTWPPPLPSLDFPNRGGRMCTFGSAAKVPKCSQDPPSLLPCGVEDNGLDYSNVWGAGVGLDFKLWTEGEWAEGPTGFGRNPLDRKTWDARAAGVVGVAFDFELIDGGVLGAPHLRVEFPILLPFDFPLPSDKGAVSLRQGELLVFEPGDSDIFPDNPPPSEEHPSGSPFWGAPEEWGVSDVSPVRVGHNVVRFSEVSNPPESDYQFDVTQLLGIQFHVTPLDTDRLDYGFCISNLTFLRE